MIKFFSAKYYPFCVFIGFLIFFTITINRQKLEFYSLQNAVVENLVENHAFGMRGTGYNPEYFYNQDTKTTQLSFIGDAFNYKGLWYPQKSYGAQYIAGIFYLPLYLLGIKFSNHFLLTSSFLLFSTSYLVVSLVLALTFYVGRKITGSNLKASLICIFLGLGSLLSGGVNIRNEETFGYWLLLVPFLLTFLDFKNKATMSVIVFLVYYSVFSLPIATIFLPFLLYRIYQHSGRQFLSFFILTNLLSIFLIFLNSYLIFHKLALSTYLIGKDYVPGYDRSFPKLDLANFVSKVNFYFFDKQTSIFVNYPLIVVGIIGIIIAGIKNHEKLFILLSILIFSFYICFISDDGWVGYGSGRFALGLFPFTYYFIAYVLKRLNPLLILVTLIFALVSISNGLFYYFSPVRNIFDRSFPSSLNLPLGEYFFLIFAVLLITPIFLVLVSKQFFHKGGF